MSKSKTVRCVKNESKELKNFTSIEINKLIIKGLIGKEFKNKRRSIISESRNQGFGYYSISKYKNGEIRTYSSSPTNVDPDWGTYETSRTTKYYKTFNDFIKDFPYKIE